MASVAGPTRSESTSVIVSIGTGPPVSGRNESDVDKVRHASVLSASLNGGGNSAGGGPNGLSVLFG